MEKTSDKTRGTKTKTRKTTIMKFRTQFDPNYKGAEGEINTLPSKTTPDMNLSVRQLLDNHSRNVHSDISVNEPQFFDQEIPKFDDITDMIEHRKMLEKSLKETKENIKQERAALKAQKEQEALDLEKQKKEAETPPKDD